MATKIAPWPCCLKLRGLRFELLQTAHALRVVRNGGFADRARAGHQLRRSRRRRWSIRNSSTLAELDAALCRAGTIAAASGCSLCCFDGGSGREQLLLGEAMLRE